MVAACGTPGHAKIAAINSKPRFYSRKPARVSNRDCSDLPIAAIHYEDLMRTHSPKRQNRPLPTTARLLRSQSGVACGAAKTACSKGIEMTKSIAMLTIIVATMALASASWAQSAGAGGSDSSGTSSSGSHHHHHQKSGGTSQDSSGGTSSNGK
jgi:hypothetical protein